jgi:hypothetical protein
MTDRGFLRKGGVPLTQLTLVAEVAEGYPSGQSVHVGITPSLLSRTLLSAAESMDGCGNGRKCLGLDTQRYGPDVVGCSRWPALGRSLRADRSGTFSCNSEGSVLLIGWRQPVSHRAGRVRETVGSVRRGSGRSTRRRRTTLPNRRCLISHARPGQFRDVERVPYR